MTYTELKLKLGVIPSPQQMRDAGVYVAEQSTSTGGEKSESKSNFIGLTTGGR